MSCRLQWALIHVYVENPILERTVEASVFGTVFSSMSQETSASGGFWRWPIRHWKFFITKRARGNRVLQTDRFCIRFLNHAALCRFILFICRSRGTYYNTLRVTNQREQVYQFRKARYQYSMQSIMFCLLSDWSSAVSAWWVEPGIPTSCR